MWLKRVLGLGLALAISYGLLLLVPMEAEPVAVAAIDGTPQAENDAGDLVGGTTVFDKSNRLEIWPTSVEPAVGVVFYPGGLVDPRAYARILTPVAAAGYLVVIVKPPFDLALADTGAAGGIIADHPGITEWVVGGHSLGGVAASQFADANPSRTPGLILWASYPYTDMSGRDEISVLSLSGTNDGLTSPEDIEASVQKLPAETSTFVALEGVTHGQFGDYGLQPGDGQPTISDEKAQRKIARRTLKWLANHTGVDEEQEQEQS